MRFVPYAAVVLSVLALSACGEDKPVWNEVELADVEKGTLVRDFNAYAEQVDEPWERSPISVVAEMLRIQSSENPNVSIVSRAPAESATEAVVTITFSRLLDDSVEATRVTVELSREGEVWQVDGVDKSNSCKPGRGHQDFSDKPCI